MNLIFYTYTVNVTFISLNCGMIVSLFVSNSKFELFSFLWPDVISCKKNVTAPSNKIVCRYFNGINGTPVSVTRCRMNMLRLLGMKFISEIYIRG